MSYRLTKIYTRTGDDGSTSLGRERISKDRPLVETLGTLDELNAALGLVIVFKIQDPVIEKFFTSLQNELFNIGAELVSSAQTPLTAEKVTALEQTLDEWNATLPPLREFLLPGGNPPSAFCHQARTICRRAERCLVALQQAQPLSNPEILRYINRLSDVLFVAARVLARQSEESETMWQRD